MKWKINVTEPDTPNGFTNSTTYTYDGIHQILTVSSQTASGTQNRSFAYSGRDMTRATNPENGSVFYTYDGAHHVLSKTDAMGQQTHYSYDAYGRLTAKYCYPLVNGQLQLDPNQTVLYSYDTNPHEPGFSNYSQGRLTAVQMNTNQWYEYNYTVPGRVQNQRLQVAAHDYDASYVWDQEGRLTSQTWPSAVSPSTGPQYQFQYDSMGRVGSMQDTSGDTLATATYGVANELLGLTYFGINEQLTYNSMFQLIHQYAPGGVIDMQSLLSGKVLCGPWQALWIEWDAGKTGFFDLKDFKTQFRGSTDNQALSALPVTKIA
jgi:YD repeat-containing protein